MLAFRGFAAAAVGLLGTVAPISIGVTFVSSHAWAQLGSDQLGVQARRRASTEGIVTSALAIIRLTATSSRLYPSRS